MARLSLLFATGLLLASSEALAIDIEGTVREAGGGIATVVTQSELLPHAGDKVDIFFTIPGAGDEVSVGTGTVSAVSQEAIQVKIDQVTGEVAKDHLVRIHSDKPIRREAAPSVAAAPPSTATPPPAAATQPPSTAPAVPPSSATPAPPPIATAPPSPGSKAKPPSKAAKKSLSFEYNVDRNGSDYLNLELSAANPALCAEACKSENRCKAWTYVKPGVQGALARCWLKDSVPPGVHAEYAVSGVRAASPPTAARKSFAGRWNTNQLGALTLAQNGKQVNGFYNGHGGGTLAGTVQGRLWQGKWTHNDGSGGTISVEMTADGNGFQGVMINPGYGSAAVNGKRTN